jgi:hypothetical protein
MCRARSIERLKLRLPAWTWAGEISTVAGASDGVAAAPGAVPDDDAATAGDGLAAGTTVTPGADAGAAELGFATHAVAANNTVETIDRWRTRICE